MHLLPIAYTFAWAVGVEIKTHNEKKLSETVLPIIFVGRCTACSCVPLSLLLHLHLLSGVTVCLLVLFVYLFVRMGGWSLPFEVCKRLRQVG